MLLDGKPSRGVEKFRTGDDRDIEGFPIAEAAPLLAERLTATVCRELHLATLAPANIGSPKHYFCFFGRISKAIKNNRLLQCEHDNFQNTYLSRSAKGSRDYFVVTFDC